MKIYKLTFYTKKFGIRSEYKYYTYAKSQNEAKNKLKQFLSDNGFIYHTYCLYATRCFATSSNYDLDILYHIISLG